MFLCPATQLDQPTITRIIREVDINPMSLAWHRFLGAEEDNVIVGVIPSNQGRGIVRQII